MLIVIAYLELPLIQSKETYVNGSPLTEGLTEVWCVPNECGSAYPLKFLVNLFYGHAYDKSLVKMVFQSCPSGSYPYNESNSEKPKLPIHP